MRKLIQTILSTYSESFSDIRKDLPQIAIFLKCMLGLAVIGVSYMLGGKLGGSSSAFLCLSLQAWRKKWFSQYD
jgi:hypothetical protein